MSTTTFGGMVPAAVRQHPCVMVVVIEVVVVVAVAVVMVVVGRPKPNFRESRGEARVWVCAYAGEAQPVVRI